MSFTTIASLTGTLAPVFLIVLLGAVLRGVGFLDDRFSSVLNKLVFWVTLPCMIVNTIRMSTIGGDWLDASLVLMAATLVIAAIAWFGAGWMGIPKASRGSFAQTVFRSNNAYVGLPVMTMAFAGRPEQGEILSLAMLTLAPCLILYNVLAVLVLTKPDGEGKGLARKSRKIATGILTNPLILACVIGSVLLFSRLPVPAFLDRTISSLGSTATAMALIALGASLTRDRLRSAMRNAHVAAFLKLVVCPLVGWAFARLLGLTPEGRFVVLVYLACPSAVASFVMAQAMKGDAVLAGGAVALTTVYSILSLAIVLLFGMP